MTLDPLANCERLRQALDNHDAIYVERGALRVRVRNIRANVEVQGISADLEEIPTTGFPEFVDLDRYGLTDKEPHRWTISAGNLTSCSVQTWSLGNGGLSLFFGAELVQEVIHLASQFPSGLSRYERYHRILGWLHCHKTRQEPQNALFLAGGASRPTDPPTATSLRERPALVAEGIVFENSGRLLRWGTSL